MPVGRPMKFSSVNELENKIDEYFKSCYEEVWIQEEVEPEEGTKNKKKKFKWVQQFDRLGNPVMRMVKHPTITGLAVFLNTSRETLMDYQNNDIYSDTIKKAKDMIEASYEQGTADGHINTIAGIFALKNFGWKDKIEVEVNDISFKVDSDYSESHD